MLLVVEIADSSLRYDLGRKARLYARFGMRELWVIDAVKMTTRVFRDPSPKAIAKRATSARPSAWSRRFAPAEFALRSANSISV